MELLIKILPLLGVVLGIAALSLFYEPKQKPQQQQQQQPRQNSPYLKFRKGTTITCPKCSRVIGVANRDIYSNEYPSSSAWDGIPIMSAMICPDDNTRYVRLFHGPGQIHTTNGWISRTPEVVK